MQLVSHPRSVPFGLGAPVHVGKFVVQGDQMLGFVTDPERLLSADQRWRPTAAPQRAVPLQLLTQRTVLECTERAAEIGLVLEVRQLCNAKMHGHVVPGMPVVVEVHVHARTVESGSGSLVQVLSAELSLRRPDHSVLCTFDLCMALSPASSVTASCPERSATLGGEASVGGRAELLAVA